MTVLECTAERCGAGHFQTRGQHHSLDELARPRKEGETLKLRLQVALQGSKGAAGRPDSGVELDSHMELRVRPHPMEQPGSLGSPLPKPEMLLGVKEGDRRLIASDEKQNLVSLHISVLWGTPSDVCSLTQAFTLWAAASTSFSMTVCQDGLTRSSHGSHGCAGCHWCQTCMPKWLLLCCTDQALWVACVQHSHAAPGHQKGNTHV